MSTSSKQAGASVEQAPREGLRRELGFWTVTSIVVGSVIGSGVFVKPGKVVLAVGDSSTALLAWVLGGLISIAGGLTIAEVAARIPKTGGVYTYMEEIYGKTIGFLCGWVQVLIYGPALIAALSLYFASLTCQALGWGKEQQVTVALVALLGLATVNAVGSKYGGMVQRFTTFAKLIPIAMITFFGVLWGNEPVLGSMSGKAAVGSLGGAILSTLWAYDGWMSVANVAGEMKNPSRDLPRAIILGLAVVVTAYLGVNIALFHVLPGSTIADFNEQAAGLAAQALFGSWGGKLISSGILISIFGCLNGNILTIPRVPWAMAERGELPFSNVISVVHKKFGTPINAIYLHATIGCLMVVMADPDQLTDLAIFSLYIFFCLAFAGLFILRKRDTTGANPDKAYRTPLYPYIPMVAVLGCAYILVSTVMDQPKMAMYSVLASLSGIPLRYLFAGKGKKA